MGETFTLNGLTKQTEVEKVVANENLEGDDLIFYHSLRADLDLLMKNPRLQTIHAILDHSKSLR